MSTNPPLVSDGSSPEDAHETVTIDRTDPLDRHRFVCPNGHVNWDKTNNHVYCRGCRQQHENGLDVDPEHWKIYDKREDRTIPWQAVEIEYDRDEHELKRVRNQS